MDVQRTWVRSDVCDSIFWESTEESCLPPLHWALKNAFHFWLHTKTPMVAPLLQCNGKSLHFAPNVSNSRFLAFLAFQMRWHLLAPTPVGGSVSEWVSHWSFQIDLEIAIASPSLFCKFCNILTKIATTSPGKVPQFPPQKSWFRDNRMPKFGWNFGMNLI